MQPYKFANGDTYGEAASAPWPSPLPEVEETPGQRIKRRARLSRRDPNWRKKTKAERNLTARVAALDERQDAMRRKEKP